MKKLIGYRFKPECEKYLEAYYKISKASNRMAIGKPTQFLIDNLVYHNVKASGVLDLWFDEVYEYTPNYKVNDWVVNKVGQLIRIKSIISHDNFIDYDNINRLFHKMRHATDDEVLKYLTDECRKRYPKGTRYRSISTNTVYKSEGITHRFTYSKDYWSMQVTHMGGFVYQLGEWAEVINDYKFGDVDVTIINGGITYKVDHIRNNISNDRVRMVYQYFTPIPFLVNSHKVSVQTIKIACITGTIDELKAIVDNLID
jgi:hypothetical protein